MERSDGPLPGDPGATVIVGHVDSATGPGAFYGLSTLHPGDKVTLLREDRSTISFTIRALRQYEKDAFPDSQVYATGGPPALRLSSPAQAPTTAAEANTRTTSSSTRHPPALRQRHPRVQHVTRRQVPRIDGTPTWQRPVSGRGSSCRRKRGDSCGSGLMPRRNVLLNWCGRLVGQPRRVIGW
ncbi:class F sortase [Streptomyces sp. NPDC050535]|uniref:class F sortase n=1 Tax=Streptomyces sp. NPDC050535 TaxID=3365626 RepID=UPI0037B7544E